MKPSAFEDFAVEMRRRWGVGPVAVLLGLAWVFLSYLVVMNLAFSVQMLFAIGIVASLVASQQPLSVYWTVMAGRVLVDMLWWVPTAGLLAGLQQVYSAAAFTLISLISLITVGRQSERVVAAFAAMAVAGSFGILQAGTRMAMAEHTARFFSPYLLVLSGMILFDTPERRWRFLQGWTAVAAIPAVVNGLQYFLGMPTVLSDGYMRWLGPYPVFQTNAFAAVLVIPPLLVFAQRYKDWRFRLGVAAVLGWCLIVAWFTYHRTVLVGIGAFVGAWLAIRRQYAALASGPAVVVLAYLSNAVVQDRFQDIQVVMTSSDERAVEQAGSGRIWIWTNTWRAYIDSDMFSRLFGHGAGRQMFALEAYMDTHNEYLSLLYQHGLMTLLLYLGFLAFIGWSSWQVAHRAVAETDRLIGELVFAFLAMVLVTNGLSNAWLSRPGPTWMMAMLVSVCLAAHRSMVGPTDTVRSAPRTRLSWE